MLLSKDRCLDGKFILSMENKGKWLDILLDEKGWTPADLSRETGIDSAVISNIRNGKRGTGYDTATKIAHALKLPIERVYRASGLLPPSAETDEETEQIIYESSKLNPQDRAEVIAYIRMKQNLRKKNGRN